MITQLPQDIVAALVTLGLFTLLAALAAGVALCVQLLRDVRRQRRIRNSLAARSGRPEKGMTHG